MALNGLAPCVSDRLNLRLNFTDFLEKKPMNFRTKCCELPSKLLFLLGVSVRSSFLVSRIKIVKKSEINISFYCVCQRLFCLLVYILHEHAHGVCHSAVTGWEVSVSAGGPIRK